MTKNGGTKDRILDAAMAVFMENGYEEASVRTILERSGTVAGSFYHYFPSKEALFEAVIERYLADYTKRFAAIADDAPISPVMRLDALLDEIEHGTEDYFGSLQGNKLHWTVQYALHEKTISAILPAVRGLLERALASGSVKSRLNVDVQTLSAVLIKGVEGILHARPMEELGKEEIKALRDSVKAYVGLLLDMQK